MMPISHGVWRMKWLQATLNKPTYIDEDSQLKTLYCDKETTQF